MGNDLFIDDYTEYLSKNVAYIPKEYHQCIALALVSAMLNERVNIRVFRAAVYPNLWMLILGPPSITKKSTAFQLAQDVLPLEPKLGAHFYRAPTTFTIEGLMAKMKLLGGTSKGASALYMRDEFGGLLSDFGKSHLAGIKDLLCQMYDVDMHGYSLGYKNEITTIEKIYMPILGNTTLQRLQESLSVDDILNGFATRFLYCYQDKPGGWVADRRPTTTDIYTMDSFKKKLRDINVHFHTNPQMEIDDETLEAWNVFNKAYQADAALRDKKIASFCSRLSSTSLKISMLLTAQQCENVIHIDAFKAACEYVKYFHAQAESIVDKIEIREIEKLTPVESKKSQRIIDIITNSSHEIGLSQNEILHKVGNGLKSAELLPILTDLIVKGTIEKYEKKTTTRPAMMYRLKK